MKKSADQPDPETHSARPHAGGIRAGQVTRIGNIRSSSQEWASESPSACGAGPEELRVEKMRFAGSGRNEDRSTIVFNRHMVSAASLRRPTATTSTAGQRSNG